jgi:hypothetical protein
MTRVFRLIADTDGPSELSLLREDQDVRELDVPRAERIRAERQLAVLHPVVKRPP